MIISKEIYLKEFRTAIQSPDSYRNKESKKYSYLNPNKTRDLYWWKKEPYIIFPNYNKDWVKRRAIIIGESESLIDKFVTNLNELELTLPIARDFMRKAIALDDAPNQIMQLLYILEDLKHQSSSILSIKKMIESNKNFRTGGNFEDLNNYEFRFLLWDDFIKRFNLQNEVKSITTLLENVANCCRNSCKNADNTEYDDMNKLCNFVSARLQEHNKIIAITCRNTDKRNITKDQIMLVAFNRCHQKDGKEFINYYYTNINNNYLLMPSKETHLSYQVHINVSRATTMLHFHHKNLLAFAWQIPIIYGECNIEQPDVLLILGNVTPSLNARDINLADLSQRIVSEFNNDAHPECIIGVRHGSWIISRDFDELLAGAKAIDSRAETSIGVRKKQIMDNIEKGFSNLKKNWLP
jgi:hypothetical protein